MGWNALHISCHVEVRAFGTDCLATATAIQQVKQIHVVGRTPPGPICEGIWLDNYLGSGLRVPLLLPNGEFRVALL